METLLVDVSTGDWPARRAQLCAFTGIAAAEPPQPTAAKLARFVGAYGDGQRTILVRLDDGQLVLSGVLWATNPCARGLAWDGPRLWWGGPAGTYERVAT